jgi:hypothetical protein
MCIFESSFACVFSCGTTISEEFGVDEDKECEIRAMIQTKDGQFPVSSH